MAPVVLGCGSLHLRTKTESLSLEIDPWWKIWTINRFCSCHWTWAALPSAEQSGPLGPGTLLVLGPVY